MGDKSISRLSILRMEDMKPIKEALGYYAQMTGKPRWEPIRLMPLQVFFDKSAQSMESMKMNPNLPALMHETFGIHIGDYSKSPGIQETVKVSSTLVSLKVADEVIEGAEPYSMWKQYGRLVDMPTPFFNVPKDAYTDYLGGASTDSIDMFKSDGGEPVDMGGKPGTVALNCEGNNNYFRAKIGIERNDIRDNKFLAVEQTLKNAGAVWYYLAGKRIIDQIITDTTVNTDTRANLDLATSVQSFLEALVNVIRSKFPGTQRNRPNTMFMHPTDAFNSIVTSSGAGGTWPFLNNFLLAPDNHEDVINNSGMARALGLKDAWETPQISAGTVLIIKRQVAHVVGLYQDLEIEDFDMTVSGLTNSALSIRFDVKQAHENGAFKITAF